MYDELVKRLWECASGECFNCSQYTPTTNASVCSKKTMKQAADAIEELAAFKAQITDGQFYCFRDGVLYEAKVEMPKGKVYRMSPKEADLVKKLEGESHEYKLEDDDRLEMGFDPYLGCYTDDC